MTARRRNVLICLPTVLRRLVRLVGRLGASLSMRLWLTAFKAFDASCFLSIIWSRLLPERATRCGIGKCAKVSWTLIAPIRTFDGLNCVPQIRLGTMQGSHEQKATVPCLRAE